MNILAIDTSCDESCAAWLDTDTWRLCADVVHSHVDAMKRWGGVVPEVASREHLTGLPLAVAEVVAQSGRSLRDLDWIAVTHRPGLVGALLVGVSYAKALAFALGKPFTALNHVEAHLFSPLIAATAPASERRAVPPFPWVALVVSGGHTELFLVESASSHRWLGGTRDDAAGEAFDKVGKLIGLEYPAGPRMDRLAASAPPEERARFRFPRARTGDFEFSYSGLKTAVSLQVQKLLKQGPLAEEVRRALAASSQEAILEPLVDKAREASRRFGVSQIVVTGGVACNSRLRALLPEAYFPAPRHCSDNAAMVALLAGTLHRAGRLEPSPWTVTASPVAGL